MTTKSFVSSRKCFVSLPAFVNAVGVVNATSKRVGANTIVFSTASGFYR